MPMTVWLRHTNLYTCSAFRSFEQAQVIDAIRKWGERHLSGT
jgi:hypothetical protein